jgi:hypothetical protein
MAQKFACWPRMLMRTVFNAAVELTRDAVPVRERGAVAEGEVRVCEGTLRLIQVRGWTFEGIARAFTCDQRANATANLSSTLP